MKASDMRMKNSTDLGKLLAEREAELREFRFGMSGGHSKNVRMARAVRKDIARIKTILKES